MVLKNLLRSYFGQGPDTTSTDFDFFTGNLFALQIDVLALDCLDV